MVDKKLTLQIEGKDIVLNFGVNYFPEHYKNDSKHDIVKDPSFQEVDIEGVDFFKTVQSLIWAGYLAECSMKKKDPEIKREQVTELVMGASEGESVDLFYLIQACRYGMTVDEFKEAAKKVKEASSEEKKT